MESSRRRFLLVGNNSEGRCGGREAVGDEGFCIRRSASNFFAGDATSVRKRRSFVDFRMPSDGSSDLSVPWLPVEVGYPARPGRTERREPLMADLHEEGNERPKGERGSSQKGQLRR